MAISYCSGGDAADTPYRLVTDPRGLELVCGAVGDSGAVGVDTETTGLNPRKDRVRLVSVDTGGAWGGRFTHVVDVASVNPSPLWGVLAGKELVFHNASFDLGFLGRLGFTAGVVHDVLLLSRLLTAGTPLKNGLADCSARELGVPLDKSLQTSDWAGDLTPGQVGYAAKDAAVLVPLYQALGKKIVGARLDRVAEIERRALPAFLWMQDGGVAFDRESWGALAREAGREADDLADRMDRTVRPRSGYLIPEGAWNWDSPDQVREAFRHSGVMLRSTDDESLSAVRHPLAGLLRDYRSARKSVTAFGPKWPGDVAPWGRIYARWNQLGSASGRTSCSSPNLQQVPRDPRYRRCFVAPPGRVLVKADYSQLQLRAAARIARDRDMLGAYARGEDLHTRTARLLTGKDEVTKADRQTAKACAFGLLFGMGAGGLRQYSRANYGLEWTEEEATKYRAAFFAAYPGLMEWHRRERRRQTAESRTVAGRRRLLDDRTPFTHRLNSPVQGTEADGAKLAMALLWERRHEVPGAFPVLFVHDEIVVEADAGQADAAAAWLKQAMLDGMSPLLDPVPVEVEVLVARTWGGG